MIVGSSICTKNSVKGFVCLFRSRDHSIFFHRFSEVHSGWGCFRSLFGVLTLGTFWTLEVCFEDSYGIPIGITLGICRILQISLFENICMGSIGVPLEGFLRVFQSLFRGLFTTINFQLLKLKKLLEVFYKAQQ